MTAILDSNYAVPPDLVGVKNSIQYTSSQQQVDDLRKLDMDLIEILLRQDIDLGVTRDVFDVQTRKEVVPIEGGDVGGGPTDDRIDRVIETKDEKETNGSSGNGVTGDLGVDDPWYGLNYTIDCETGEHVVLDDAQVAGPSSSDETEAGADFFGGGGDGDDDARLDATELLSLADELDAIPLLDDLSLVASDIEDDVEVKGRERRDQKGLDDDCDSCGSNCCEDLLLASSPTSASLISEDEGRKEDEIEDDDDDDALFVDDLRELEAMIQSAHNHHLHHHHHHHHHGVGNVGGRLQPRVQYLRSVSMEQRWQDLANFMSYAPPPPPPPPSSETDMHHHHGHHHHNMGMGMLHNGSTAVVHGHHVVPQQPQPPQPPQHTNYTLANYGIDNRTSSVLIQNATLPPPVADINSNMTFPGEVGGDQTNVGAAVVTSMSTLTDGSDSMADTAPHAHYQLDAGAMMFPVNHTEVNQTTEGFLSSILNDEDLQLMDMAMNEGMYTMRILENDDAMDTSSDSAVSSMGSSERVPSTSDGEWMEAAAAAAAAATTTASTTNATSSSTGSPHPTEEQDQRFYGGMDPKYRAYNYSYAPGMAPTPTAHHRSTHSSTVGNGSGGSPADDGAAGMDRRMPPVAQKKYQLFGKRVGIEQPMGGVTYGALPRGSASMPQPTAPMKYPGVAGGYLYPGVQDHNSSSSYGSLEGATAPNTSVGPVETKYSCSLEFARQLPVSGTPASLNHVQHNHTYRLPSTGIADAHRPIVRDKHKKAAAVAAAAAAALAGEDHLPRDEKRARAMKIPLSTDDIINLPMDEFNERLSKYDLTEPQLALIRDIRRRGKNKVAAQNCRKRKLDQILTLADEVQRMHHERERLMHQQQSFVTERQRMKDKFSQLYRHVFQSLRDPDGNPYSPYEYSLQQAADGNILLVPRNGTVNMELQETCKGGGPKNNNNKGGGGGGRKEEVKK